MPVLVGISGPSGAGKSEMVKKVVEHYGQERVLVLSGDRYYRNPRELRDRCSIDDPEAFLMDFLKDDLVRLQMGKPIQVHEISFSNFFRQRPLITVIPKEIILVDGVILYHFSDLRKLFDLKVYVDAEFETAFLRRKRRDVKERGFSERLTEESKPTVKFSFDTYTAPSKIHADIVINNNGEQLGSLDISAITVKIDGMLRTRARLAGAV